MKVTLLKKLNELFIVKFDSEIQNVKLVDLSVDLSKESNSSHICVRGRIIVYKYEKNIFVSDFILPRTAIFQYVVVKKDDDMKIISQEIVELGYKTTNHIKDFEELLKKETDILDGQYLVFK